MFKGIASLRRRARWSRVGLLETVAAVAVLGALAGAPLSAYGETGSPGGASGLFSVTAGLQYGSVAFSLTNTAAGVWCSTLGRRASLVAGEPVELAAGVGATQSTASGTRFPIRLAVTVTDAEQNPVPGTPVTFAAPASGPSARFTIRPRGARGGRSHISYSHTVEVETDACGIAVAPPLTAGSEGGYIVRASARHVRSVAFALVNEAPGQQP
jgi:hypothetical protein